MEQVTTAFFSLALVLMFAHCFLAIPGPAANDSTDQSALLAFKSHITYDPSNKLASNWSTNSSICNWIGVSCSETRVTSLDLSNMGLRGTIPPQIGNLSFLTYFNISNNDFHGHLSIELAGLHRLKVFDLHVNDFSGEIPATIFNVSSLQQINFENNSFSGSLPDDLCHQLPRLTTFFAYSNEFFGEIPSTLGECRELQHLTLSRNKFIGFIPRGIGNLTMLKELRLGYNNLQGEVPPEFGSLHSLETLTLGSANLTGTIPSSIFNISTLKELFVYENRLSGFLPMDICNSDLPSLEILSLFRNQLTGSIPRHIANCTSLEALDLSENKLSGFVPHDVGTLQYMWILNCRENNLTGSIPSTLFNMSQLLELDLTKNNLSGNLPSTPGLWSPNLFGLYLGMNNISGVIPNSISNATNLHFLDLSINMFTGSIPHSLGNIKLLETLILNGNQLTSDPSSSLELSIFASLTNCRHLTDLWLSFNPLNGILPPIMGNLSSSMQTILLGNCEIKGEIPREIGNLSGLILLSADGNNLTTIVPMTIRGLSNLQLLSLSNNNLQGLIPVDLCHLNHLDSLFLDQNKFMGPLPECLGNITSLRHVNLSSNRLTSSIPKSFCNLKDLLRFNLSSNSLSGYLPSELGNLKVAVVIDLSMNQFSGEIPSTIGGLLSLQNLYLGHNRLEGSIPQTFGNLISMEFLDMSHNNLTGEIPRSLEALVHLKYFNVSFNRLSGEIPSGGPFTNLTNESFMSNEALCGTPRLNVPPCHLDSHRESRKQRLLVLMYVLLPIGSILFTVAIIFANKRCRQRSKSPTTMDMSPVRSHRRISYHEILQATNLFAESNLLGTGSFSSVYKGILQDGTILAVKVFNLKLEGAFRSFDTECEVLRNLRHRNLTGVISSCSTPDFKGLVLEYMPNGTLEKWLYTHNYFLDILKRLEILIDVACALEYLHYGYSTPVVHCDLKPSNVLLDNDMVAHVSDFGVAKILYAESIAQTRTIATIGYIAPEYGSEGLVSTRCDVYSFGIMLMETFTRRKPTDAMFDGDMGLKGWVDNSMANGVAEIIDANLLRPNEEQYAANIQCASGIMELALRCSSESPEERMNIKDVLASLKKIKLRYVNKCTQS